MLVRVISWIVFLSQTLFKKQTNQHELHLAGVPTLAWHEADEFGGTRVGKVGLDMVIRSIVWLIILDLFPGQLGRSSRTRVQIGYCGKVADIDAAKAAGFDYIELALLKSSLSDSDYEKLAAKLKAAKLPVGNLLIHSSYDKAHRAGINKNRTDALRRFDRVSRLGTEVVVFGSGPARRVPDGFSHEEAFQQLVDFCRRIGPEARLRKITVAIEPQRKQECNIINNEKEGLALIKAVNDPNIQLIVDFYHMAEEKEDPAIISIARNHIRHLHMANPQNRVFPLSSKEYDYDSFFENLRKIGYHKRISIEARSSDFSKEAPLAIEFLRQSFAAPPR